MTAYPLQRTTTCWVLTKGPASPLLSTLLASLFKPHQNAVTRLSYDHGYSQFTKERRKAQKGHFLKLGGGFPSGSVGWKEKPLNPTQTSRSCVDMEAEEWLDQICGFVSSQKWKKQFRERSGAWQARGRKTRADPVIPLLLQWTWAVPLSEVRVNDVKTRMFSM